MSQLFSLKDKNIQPCLPMWLISFVVFAFFMNKNLYSGLWRCVSIYKYIASIYVYAHIGL